MATEQTDHEVDVDSHSDELGVDERDVDPGVAEEVAVEEGDPVDVVLKLGQHPI